MKLVSQLQSVQDSVKALVVNDCIQKSLAMNVAVKFVICGSFDITCSTILWLASTTSIFFVLQVEACSVVSHV